MNRYRTPILCALLLAASQLSPSVKAQTTWTWVNAADGLWSNSANWNPNTGVPDEEGDSVIINHAGTFTVGLNSGTWTIGNLSSSGASGTTTVSGGTLFLDNEEDQPVLDINKATTISAILTGSNGFQKTGAGTLTLSSGANTISGGIEVAGGILAATNLADLGPAAGNTITLSGGNLRLGVAGSTVNLTHDLSVTNGTRQFLLLDNTSIQHYTLSGDLDVASGSTLQIGGAQSANKTVEISGTVTGSGTISQSAGYRTQIFSFADDSTFNGTIATGGLNTYRVSKDNALGQGSTWNGSSATLASLDGSAKTLNSHILIAGSSNVTATFGSATDSSLRGKLTFEGNLTVGGDNNSRVLNVAGADMILEVEGNVLGGGNSANQWTKSGDGTLILSGSGTGSNYNRNTIVSAGTLLVNGVISASSGNARTYTINDGATLGGTGIIRNRVTTIETGGRLAPGDSTALITTGHFTVESNVTFQTGGILSIGLNGNLFDLDESIFQYDRFSLTGSLGLGTAGVNNGAILNVTLGDDFVYTEGDIFTIISGYTSYSGWFEGLTNGSLLNAEGHLFKINYGVNAITLEAVPEPQSLMLLAGATGLLWMLRRRRVGV